MLDIESGAEVSYEWATDVHTATTGTERRKSLRRTPRERYAFSAVLDDEQLRKFQSSLVIAAAQGSSYLVGLMHEGLVITAPSTGTVITVPDTSKIDWGYNTSRIAVYDPATKEVVTTSAQSITPTTINTYGTIGSVGRIGAIVMPAMPCYLEGPPKLGHYAVNASRLDFVARAILFGNLTGQWVVNGATVTTFNSLPVFDKPVQANTIVGRAIAPGSQILDGGGALGSFGQRQSVGFARQVRYSINRDVDRQWLKAFMGAIVGRLKPFYLPTWKPDFPFTGSASGGSLTFTGSTTTGAPGLNYAGTWALTGAHNAVQLKLTDGTIAYRTITGYADNGNGTQTITLNSALAGTLEMVSLLEKCRLDSDVMPTRYKDHRGMAEFQVMVVKQ